MKTYFRFQISKLCFCVDCHFNLSKCNAGFANWHLLKDIVVRNYTEADSKPKLLPWTQRSAVIDILCEKGAYRQSSIHKYIYLRMNHSFIVSWIIHILDWFSSRNDLTVDNTSLERKIIDSNYLSKCHLLCSTEYIKLYLFGTTWGWEHFYFCLNSCFNSTGQIVWKTVIF